MKEAVAKLKLLGAEVVHVDLGFRTDDFDLYALGLFSTSLGHLVFTLPENNLITSYIAAFAANYADRIGPKHLLAAENWIYTHSNQIQQQIFTQGFKAIIMPTLCSPYIPADLGKDTNTQVMIVDGEPCDSSTWKYSFTWPWNLFGHHPIVNAPIGMTKEGIPLGMQIIGDTYDDLAAFQIAYNWSQATLNFYRDGNFPGNK